MTAVSPKARNWHVLINLTSQKIYLANLEEILAAWYYNSVFMQLKTVLEKSIISHFHLDMHVILKHM